MRKEEDNKSKSTVILIEDRNQNERKTTGISPKPRKKGNKGRRAKFLFSLGRLNLFLSSSYVVCFISFLMAYMAPYSPVFEPCTDFYKFACSSSIVNSQLFDAYKFLSSIQKKMLENPDAQNIAEAKGQNFYISCLKAAVNRGSIVFSKDVEKMLDKFDKIPEGNLQEKLELLHNEFGLSPFFYWAIFRDEKDSDKNVITIHQSVRNNFEDEDLTDNSAGYFTKQVDASNEFKTMMDKMLGNRLNFTPEFDDFDELIELDKEVDKMDLPPLVNASDGQYSAMNLTQLENLTSFINWKKFFNNGLNLNPNLNLTIHENEKIVVWCPQFLSNLSRKIEHLQKTRVESGKLLDKFLIWQAGKEIFGQIIIATKEAAVINTCSSLAVQYFKLAALSMHRRHIMTKYPDLEDRFEMVQEMVVNIRQELVLSLKEAEWLNETSREDAVQKAEETGELIGYPDIVKDPKLLEQYYEFCPQMNESDFAGNMINLLKVDRLENLKSLRVPTDKNGTDKWLFEDVIAQNAFAEPDYNLVHFPVPNLLPPHFSPELPLSVNYGRVGFTIGHELAHCYQKFGSYSDNNQSACLMNQYSNFSCAYNAEANETRTFNENFADNVGFDITARAFHRVLNNTSSSFEKDENNQVLGNTDEKLFFTSFAEGWCMNFGLFYWSIWNWEDSHSPSEFRVLGTLRNSQTFSKTFDCSSNSPMNPEQKCSIFNSTLFFDVL